jgi:protein-S-isoprenylcysteine O-methyltransferase Ste14
VPAMRNPIRPKNLRLRFLPYIAIGIAVVALRRPSAAGFAMGLPLVLAGAALRTWGTGFLVKTDELTIAGPYAHLRHPLYLGTLLVATGFALILGGVWSLALLAFLWPWFAFHYFPRKERAESARLAARHGEAFARYRDAVPALWPRLQPYRPGHRPGPVAGASSAGAMGEASRAAQTGTWRLDRYSENNELGTLLAILGGLALLVARTVWGAT